MIAWASRVFDAASLARAVVAAESAARVVNAVTIDPATTSAAQAAAVHVVTLAGNSAAFAEAVRSGVEAVESAAGAGDVAEAASQLLSLPVGPAVLLGLAPGGVVTAAGSWWPSQHAWRITEAVSFVIALAGYGYCRADTDRRRLATLVPQKKLVRATVRPTDGL